MQNHDQFLKKFLYNLLIQHLLTSLRSHLFKNQLFIRLRQIQPLVTRLNDPATPASDKQQIRDDLRRFSV